MAETVGCKYIGIDLSQRQIDANQINADKMGVCPAWYCDDSKNADKYIQDETADFVFTCPPYHNLEKYSNHPQDLSNMSYTDFLAAYEEIIYKACNKLKNDRFCVFVVGDIRDAKGAYRDFVSETKRIFRDNGLTLYNEMILLENYGSRALTAGGMFRSRKKLAKVHQNILVFYKGDIKNIKGVYRERFKWSELPQKE